MVTTGRVPLSKWLALVGKPVLAYLRLSVSPRPMSRMPESAEIRVLVIGVWLNFSNYR